jgi:Ca-activated chloride channel homolog
MVIAAAVIALLVGAGATAVVRMSADGERESTSAAVGGCAAQAKLRVAAAPELVPVLEAAAREVAPPVGACPVIAVDAQQPAQTIGARDQSAGYDAWVPPSSLWLRQAAAAKGGFAGAGTSLARTPVVVALPEGYARQLGWPGKQPAWTELAALTYSRQIRRFSMPDAERDTTGMLAALAVYAAIGRTTPDRGIAQLRALTFRSRLADAAADPQALLDRMADATDAAAALREIGLFAATEQQLWRYSRREHKVQLVAGYPRDGVVEADYPLALRPAAAGDGTRRELADKLAGWFASAAGAAALADHGFRGPARADAAQAEAARAQAAAAAPVGPGFLPRYAPPIALPDDPAAATAALRQWARYKRLAFQLLVLVDASGSMNEPARDRAGNVTTKAEMLRRAGVLAAQLIGEDTSVGLWMFATPQAQSPPYTEVVPFGPIEEQVGGASRRQLFGAAAQNYQAYPSAGTPLFEAVLRADAEMRRRYRPDAVTLIVVLTDGHDRDTAYAMPRADFLNRLSTGRDRNKPVPIHGIGYGGDADMATLTEVARRTGGQAVTSSDPADLASAMAKIFLAAHRVTG